MVELQKGDRVIVAKDGHAVKCRVAVVPGFGKVGVTFAKGEQPTMYQTADVFPLYRYVTVDAPLPIKMLTGRDTVEMVEPLFFA